MADYDELIAALIEGSETARLVRRSDSVHKDECCLSCSTPYTPGGIFISLSTFNSFSPAFLSVVTADLELFLHQTSKRVKNNLPSDDNTLSIISDWTTHTSYHIAATRRGVLIPGEISFPVPSELAEVVPESVIASIESVIKSTGAEEKAAAQSWEAMDEPRPVSKYAEDLEISNPRNRSEAIALGRCEMTGEASDNLWLNLSDGFIGGGRRNWDGSGGSNGALDHYRQVLNETGKKFPLVVKLGTISADGSAEVYSYAEEEDGLVKDPRLEEHLSRWGLEIGRQEKTAKTVAEMEVALNKEFAWDRITEAGKDLEILSGEELVGLRNLGNTCYMNSFLQVLSKVPDVCERYRDSSGELRRASWLTKDASTLELAKIVNALTTGEYAITSEDVPPIAPSAFRNLFCKGHSEFSSLRQQDVVEFMQFFLEKSANSERNKFPASTASLFNFEVVERLECQGRQKVERRSENMLGLQVAFTPSHIHHSQKHTPTVTEAQALTQVDPPEVSFEACLAKTFASESIEGFKYKGVVTEAAKTTRFLTMPPYLWIAVRRYYIDSTWQPQKLDVAVPMPHHLDLETFRGDAVISGPTLDDAEDLEISELQSLGFSKDAAARALKAVSGAGVEAAAEWLFTHPDDTPQKFPGSADILTSLGFSDRQAEAALQATNGDAEKAADWLYANIENLDAAVSSIETGMSPATPQAPEAYADGLGKYELTGFISHIGKSVGSGHYVAHLKRGSDWVIFNDEKVAKSEAPPFSFGYLYLYKRRQ